MKIFKRHEAPATRKQPSAVPESAASQKQSNAGEEGDVYTKPAQADEKGGPKGPEPTRFGDWERKGRCVDF